MLVRFILSLFIVSLLLKNTEQGLRENINNTENLLRIILKPKIVNGVPAELGEIPYQVGFKTPFMGRNMYYTFCGGSILSPSTVLSAAHCFIPSKVSFFKYCTGRLDTKHYRTTFAVAGNLRSQVRYSAHRSAGQWRRIGLIAFPFSYHFPIDDIAIVHLTTPYQFDKFVSAIPIATQFEDYIGLDCLASGYGKLEKRQLSYNLQKALLEIMPMRQCNKVFGLRMRKFVCTVDRVTNVLQGDSGGPLVCKKTGDPAEGPTGVLVGITSGGVQGRGSIFTRVSAFHDYIERGRSETVILAKKIQFIVGTFWMQQLYYEID